MNILEKMQFSPNQAIVFDIDETLINSKTNRLITSVYDLYQYCLDKSYHIYIITARAGTMENMHITIQQLQSLNITGYKRLYFRIPHDRHVSRFKKLARKSIPHKVIMSVGDQPGDFGEYGGIGVRVE